MRLNEPFPSMRELMLFLLFVAYSSAFQLLPPPPLFNHRRKVLMAHPANLVDLHSLNTQAFAAQAIAHNYLEAYATLLRDKPVETKATTAGILTFTGDAIAQSRSDSEKYDLKRGLTFLTFGAIYTGTLQHFWFEFLNNNISHWGVKLGVWGEPAVKAEWWRFYDLPSRLLAKMAASSSHINVLAPPSDAALAGAKVVVNQFGAVPFIYMPLFFAMTGALAQLGPVESLNRAKPLYFPLLQRNYLFWLPTQFFQFLVLPPDFQIPFLCCASLCWTVILSSIGGGATVTSSSATVAATDSEDDQLQLAMKSGGAVNELTDSVSLRDVKNAAADLVPNSVNGALGGAASVVSDATIAGGLGLLASTASEANFGITVGGIIATSGEIGQLVNTGLVGSGGIIATSGEIGQLVNTGLGGSMGQADVGIVAVSIISAGVGALISVTNEEADNVGFDAVVEGSITDIDGNGMGRDAKEALDHLVESFANITVLMPVEVSGS
mmetsp:Transcript_40163/g.48172  ORF Transcript_40163/g.48172 Transcript_40163/m.48172 type:complete len:495 (+) Transcript_40163:196-1680(+)